MPSFPASPATARWIPLLVCVTLLAGCTGGGFPMSQSIDIGTHSLYIDCIGTSGPVVVIDVGVGDSYENWRAVREQLALTNIVCSYDRAGYGQSEPGPLPRHSLQVATELKTLLENAAQPGPYLLVGHSLGGLNMQVFAARYPDVTRGLVLLDPVPLGWLQDGSTFPELTALYQQQAQEMCVDLLHRAGEVVPQDQTPAVLNDLQRLLAVSLEDAAINP